GIYVLEFVAVEPVEHFMERSDLPVDMRPLTKRVVSKVAVAGEDGALDPQQADDVDCRVADTRVSEIDNSRDLAGLPVDQDVARSQVGMHKRWSKAKVLVVVKKRRPETREPFALAGREQRVDSVITLRAEVPVELAPSLGGVHGYAERGRL